MSKVNVPRSVKNAFDAASRTRESNRHFKNADRLSADAALSQAVRHLVISRARLEVSNNGYADGMMKTLANTTIGRGPRLQLFVSDEGPEGLDKAAKESLQRRLARWRHWSRNVKMTQKLKVARRAKCIDGETFIRIVENQKVKSHVRVDFYLNEAEQVQGDQFGTLTEVWDTGVPKEVDGIFFDKNGNVTKYRFLKVHPGSNALVFKGKKNFTEVDAESVIHYANITRPGQTRGLSEISSTLNIFNDLRRFTNATLTSAEIAADISFMIESDLPADDSDMEEIKDPIEFMDIIEIKKGSGTALPRGYKAKQFEAEHPNDRYQDFCDSKLMEAARPLSMPFNIAKGNSSSYNYASGRLDHQNYHSEIWNEREDIEQTILDRLLETFEDIDREVYPGDYANEDFIFHSWMWDGFGHVDPVKEANSQETRLRTTATLEEECAKEGKDWQQVLRQRSREQKMKKDLGIMDDYVPVRKKKPEKKEEDDDDDDKNKDD